MKQNIFLSLVLLLLSIPLFGQNDSTRIGLRMSIVDKRTKTNLSDQIVTIYDSDNDSIVIKTENSSGVILYRFSDNNFLRRNQWYRYKVKAVPYIHFGVLDSFSTFSEYDRIQISTMIPIDSIHYTTYVNFEHGLFSKCRTDKSQYLNLLNILMTNPNIEIELYHPYGLYLNGKALNKRSRCIQKNLIKDGIESSRIDIVFSKQEHFISKENNEITKARLNNALKEKDKIFYRITQW